MISLASEQVARYAGRRGERPKEARRDMISKALIERMFGAASIQRWNDHVRPVQLTELDKLQPRSRRSGRC